MLCHLTLPLCLPAILPTYWYPQPPACNLPASCFTLNATSRQKGRLRHLNRVVFSGNRKTVRILWLVSRADRFRQEPQAHPAAAGCFGRQCQSWPPRAPGLGARRLLEMRAVLSGPDVRELLTSTIQHQGNSKTVVSYAYTSLRACDGPREADR